MNPSGKFSAQRVLQLITVFAFLLFMNAVCPGPTGPKDKFSYDFPLKVGKNWTYQHFFTSLPHDSLSQLNRYYPDTVLWSVTESNTVLGKSCYIISSTRKSSRDTVYAAYRQVPDSGIYLWAMDTAYAGQELLKTTALPGFRKYNQLIIPVFYGTEASWDYTDGKGQLVTKQATLDNKTDNELTVNTSIDGKKSCREKFTADGLAERVFVNDKFYDDLKKDSIITIDSLVLIR